MIKFGESVAVILISIITLGFYAALFLLAHRIPALAVLFFLCGFFLYLIVSRSNIRRSFWLFYLYIELGIMGLFSVVEWHSAHLIAAVLGIAGSCVVVLWGRRVSAPIVFVREKPLRRALSVFIAFSVFSYLAAAHTVLIFFFESLSPLMGHVIVSAIVSLGTYLVWSLYYTAPWREFVIPLAVVFLLAFEASLVANLGSSGYLVRAFGITFLWYIVQLFMRFHFGNRDIIWSKQKYFLGASLLLYIFFVLIIRFL